MSQEDPRAVEKEPVPWWSWRQAWSGGTARAGAGGRRGKAAGSRPAGKAHNVSREPGGHHAGLVDFVRSVLKTALRSHRQLS